ncbi:hypothetical protein U1Q18_050119 [Sarracenia purpurea var. burkii]
MHEHSFVAIWVDLGRTSDEGRGNANDVVIRRRTKSDKESTREIDELATTRRSVRRPDAGHKRYAAGLLLRIATTVIAVAESNSDVLDTRARARNSEDASRVPPGTLNLKLFSAYDRGAAAVTTIAFSAPVAAATTTTVDSNWPHCVVRFQWIDEPVQFV